MTLRRSLFVSLFVIVALSCVYLAAVRRPSVEPGLQVAKSGVVIDARTREPVADAYVVVRWLEQARGKFSSALAGQCLAHTIVRTDEHGRYQIPASRFAIPEESAAVEHAYFWDAYAYAPGRSLDSRVSHPNVRGSIVPGDQNLEPMLLAAQHSAPEQRVAELADTLAHFACGSLAEDSPLAEQIYSEAYAAACLPEPNGAVSALARLRGTADPCAQHRQASVSR